MLSLCCFVENMNHVALRFFFLCSFLSGFLGSSFGTLSAEPIVQIHSPKDGSRIEQEQSFIFVSGKVFTREIRTPNVDIFFVLDVSGSTAHYAGVDLGDFEDLPGATDSGSRGRPQITVFGGGFGMGGRPPVRDLKNSIMAAEVAATRRLLSQLNPETTRIGLITFGEEAKLLQPLTHDFEQVRQSLRNVLSNGPYGGTHMAGGIRLAIKELAGLGQSARRVDAVKVQFLLTDGFPTLPIGGGKRATAEDTRLAINAARIGGKAGIKAHAFALGEEALSYPRAAVGVAEESGGTFTPVVRPADILGVLENISVVGVGYVQVLNETTGQRASSLRLASDGFFSSALPVVEGLNRIRVWARSSDDATGQSSLSVYYLPGRQRSLDLEVFLEKEKSLNLELERLGKSREEILGEIDSSKKDSLREAQKPPPPPAVR
jgi:hypothetical protein